MKNSEKYKRVTVYVDTELEKQVKEIAEKENWGFAYAGFVLLQQAVREKKRNRRGMKNGQIENSG